MEVFENSGREPEVHQTPDERLPDAGPSTSITTSTREAANTFMKTVPGGNLNEQRINQEESPRRIETREASREDALVLTRQFFASVNEQS